MSHEAAKHHHQPVTTQQLKIEQHKLALSIELLAGQRTTNGITLAVRWR